jgi:hypothetical protein
VAVLLVSVVPGRERTFFVDPELPGTDSMLSHAGSAPLKAFHLIVPPQS